MQHVFELNMDGLVGPTHHYAGLAPGNIASITNALTHSNPRAAALQGLDKMRFLFDLGLKQGLLPPQQRPNLHLLHQLGFKGTPCEQIIKASRLAPDLLSACYSASSMWAANAATVSPSSDTRDNTVHFTAANLVSTIHRHQEAEFSKKLLERIFQDTRYFSHHAILPSSLATADEGAANHNRLAASHAGSGLHLFVYGRQSLPIDNATMGPQKYPARQTREASEAIARSHGLHPKRVFFARQNPEAIDAGVFHNDVISVANESVFLTHERAFCDKSVLFKQLTSAADFPLTIIEIKEQELSLQTAVATYLFNSQLVSLPYQKQMLLLAPIECQTSKQAVDCIDNLIANTNNSIKSVHYIDLKQSMRNGGGPACLRLRVPLKEEELSAMHQQVLVSDDLFIALGAWICKHYREELKQADLADPQLMNESLTALDELTQLLDLGSIYSFQSESSV